MVQKNTKTAFSPQWFILERKCENCVKADRNLDILKKNFEHLWCTVEFANGVWGGGGG